MYVLVLLLINYVSMHLSIVIYIIMFHAFDQLLIIDYLFDHGRNKVITLLFYVQSKNLENCTNTF